MLRVVLLLCAAGLIFEAAMLFFADGEPRAAGVRVLAGLTVGMGCWAMWRLARLWRRPATQNKGERARERVRPA